MKSLLTFTTLLAIWQCVFACNVYEYGVTEEGKKAVVNLHNDVRKLISHEKVPGQPRGINLKKMQWDDYLAGQAQNIANTCVFEHVKVQDNRFWWVGQNLFLQPTLKIEKGADWKAAVDAWYNEYSKYTYSEHYVFDKQTGHYTQLVWANTSYVGCGYTYYPDGNQYKKLYVCNYGPGGNVDGETIYKQGNSGCEELC